MLKGFAGKAILVAAGIAVVAPAPALANWRTSHPWRVHDNARLRNIDRRIGAERREGDLTKAQAKNLRFQDRSIRQEERDMARLDKGGHLTKADQHALTQQLNELSSDVPK